ncbi:hypothetical protein Daesc_000339 [Daldinia eschscholtzii]|uniref:Fungal-type protein kinase domain-containing protein n=1 Tax=Daldinia eschscholtzii TaxID=292717 RepID=A0AAX6MZE7_9PEZI
MPEEKDQEYGKDPHPRERRWISRRMSIAPIDRSDDSDPDTILFKHYAIRRIVRLLLRNNIHAHDAMATAHRDDMEESDFEDEVRPDWAAVARRFTVNARYDPNRTHYQNGLIGYAFVDEFHKFCQENGLDILKMKDADIELVRDRVDECLYDWPSSIHREQVTTNFDYKLSKSWEDRKVLDVASLGTAEDPTHVRVVRLKGRYKAWSVVEDVSVDGYGMTPARYEIPRFHESVTPMEDYYWFGAEVVSPPLAFDSPQSVASIQKVCSVLRGNLRCHKPMEVSTGFHVHLGHKHGWNLLQMKRFITLWVLVESRFIHLHRKDRGAERMAIWCANLLDGTCLARALFHQDAYERFKRAGCKPRSSPGEKARNMGNMREHVDVTEIEERESEFIENIWQYTTISELTDAVSGAEDEDGDFIRPALRVRIRGNKKSEPPTTVSPGTIEVRTMHGTLDADQ